MKIAVGNIIKKINMKSVYVKYTIIFTILIIMAQSISFFVVIRLKYDGIMQQFTEKLVRKAALTQRLYQQGYRLNEDYLSVLGDDSLVFVLIDGEKEVPQPYSEDITLAMMERAKKGEIVIEQIPMSYIFSVPFCLFQYGDQYAMLTANRKQNDLYSFITAVRSSMFIGSLSGAIIIAMAVIMLMRPIKKVSLATKQVARGNFDIRLTSKSKDEIGELIRNFDRMISELQKNEYLKKDFVSSFSHEFKTPITSIHGFAKLLKNPNIAPSEFEEYTNIIIRESDRLTKLSAKLMHLILLDNTHIQLKKELFELDDQIRNCILLLQNQWEDKNIAFDIRMGNVFFYGNAEMLSQVWINLLENAIKFSPVGGTIFVKVLEERQGMRIMIQDEGIGMEAKELDQIFQRFYKVDKSSDSKGNGLGLSIVKRIVQLHEGHVDVESTVGVGTTFAVCFKGCCTAQK